MILTFSFLLPVGCCEVYERAVAMYDETGTCSVMCES